MIYFDKLIGAHEGRPAVVICGGPSAPEQLDTVRKKLDDPVLISVNEHGCKLTKCDYIVALDNIGHKDRGAGCVVDMDAQSITPYRWADVKLTGYWNSSNSGRTAVWVAWKMGCSPIVIVGADLYQNGAYHWNRQLPTAGNNEKFEGHLREWGVMMHRVPAEIVTCAGGPLVEHDVVPKFDGRRKYPQVEYRDPERDHIGTRTKPAPEGTRIRIERNTWIEGQQYWIGEEPVVRPRSARQVVAAGKAIYVN